LKIENPRLRKIFVKNFFSNIETKEISNEAESKNKLNEGILSSIEQVLLILSHFYEWCIAQTERHDTEFGSKFFF